MLLFGETYFLYYTMPVKNIFLAIPTPSHPKNVKA